MNRLTRFLLGFWIVSATVLLLKIIVTTYPEVAAENDAYLFLFFVSSIFTAFGVWLND